MSAIRNIKQDRSARWNLLDLLACFLIVAALSQEGFSQYADVIRVPIDKAKTFEDFQNLPLDASPAYARLQTSSTEDAIPVPDTIAEMFERPKKWPLELGAAKRLYPREKSGARGIQSYA